MEESKFCTACGKSIEPGMQFCPHCGMVVSGSEADEEFKERQKEFGKVILMARRNWLIFFLGIYAIPVIIASIIVLVDASATANAVWASDEFQSWIASHGYDYSLQDIQNFITYAGAMGLASGICALISLILVYIRKLWIVAVITCFLAAVLCFWSIFGIIIGFLVAWMIVGSRDMFES
jgi:hypothetical protein